MEVTTPEDHMGDVIGASPFLNPCAMRLNLLERPCLLHAMAVQRLTVLS